MSKDGGKHVFQSGTIAGVSNSASACVCLSARCLHALPFVSAPVSPRVSEPHWRVQSHASRVGMSSGQVCLDPQDVAIKEIFASATKASEMKQEIAFQREVTVMSRVLCIDQHSLSAAVSHSLLAPLFSVAENTAILKRMLWRLACVTLWTFATRKTAAFWGLFY